MSLTVTVASFDLVTIVHLSGELDHVNSDELRLRLATLGQELDQPRIVVDLARLDFCDATGLTAFVLAAHVAEGRGGWLRLEYPQPIVARLLELTGLRTLGDGSAAAARHPSGTA
ncbi:anti-sigma factor antagonist [Longispora sp. NPDC051575]|uniref:anti-sigma factor antagonist n=1 Tax=Longispora sp. NPDC051575 TaxID=3154943 RepID=UPI0034482BD4